jgi:hypothetical protein
MNDKIHLTVSDFEPANAFSFELAIEFGLNNYNYAIIDGDKKVVKAISSAQTSIFNEIDGSLLQTHFAKTKISLITQKFTFIPTSLFQKDNLAVYTKYIQPQETETVLVNHLYDGEITAIYAFDKLLIDKIEKHFPAAKLYPQFIPLITAVNYGFSLIKEPQIFANFKSDFLEIIIYNNGKFQFYNLFEFKNDDEILYFLLLATQQNNLHAVNSMLKISGSMSTQGDTYKRLKEHFNRIEIIDQDSLPLTSLGLQTSVMPRFFSLLSLHLCE